MPYISQYQYYENGGNQPENANWGSYQYVSLYDIVNNFMLMYAGNHSLVNNEERYKGFVSRKTWYTRIKTTMRLKKLKYCN